MDLTKIKMPIGIVILVIAQAFGIIYWVAGQEIGRASCRERV